MSSLFMQTDDPYTLFVGDYLDYSVTYSRWLRAGDVIIASAWEVVGEPPPFNVGDESFTMSMTVVWLEALLVRPSCEVINHVTTSDGRRVSVPLHFRIVNV